MNSDSFLIHYYDIDKYICVHIQAFIQIKLKNKVPAFMILYHVGDLSM